MAVVDRVLGSERVRRSQEEPDLQSLRRRKELHSGNLLQRSGQEGQARLVPLDGLLREANAAERLEVPGLSRPGIASLKLCGATPMAIPSLQAADKEAIEDLYTGLTPEDRETFVAGSRELGQLLFALAEKDPEALPSGRPPMGFREVLKETASGSQDSRLAKSTCALVHAEEPEESFNMLLQMAMYGAEQYLRDFVEGLAGRIKMEQELRASIMELEEMLEEWPEEGGAELFSYTELTRDENGAMVQTHKENVALTKEEAEALLQRLKQQLEACGGFSVIEQAELQRRVHAHQQAVTMLSNMSKVRHEAMKAAISNIRS